MRLLMQMDEDIFYDNIQQALESLPDNFNILEERIDIEVQKKYFEFANEVRKRNISDEYFESREELFSDEISAERKKEILSAISAVDDVKAYRTIEKYVENESSITELKQWAILAMQESRMLLQSSLLDEQQIFISTGLGGKGQKLRYFVVFINKEIDKILNKTQRKLVKNELIFALNKNDGVFETIDFLEGFSTALVILPIKTDLKSILKSVIEECNQYGNFLKEDMVVTNVKVLSRLEIVELLSHNKNKNPESFGE